MIVIPFGKIKGAKIDIPCFCRRTDLLLRVIANHWDTVQGRAALKHVIGPGQFPSPGEKARWAAPSFVKKSPFC